MHVSVLQVITADTSYSANTKWEKGSAALPSTECTRGSAVLEIVLVQCENSQEPTRVFAHGTLSNGLSYESEIPLPTDTASLVGRHVSKNVHHNIVNIIRI